MLPGANWSNKITYIRRTLSALLLIAGVLLSGLASMSIYARDTIFDQDGFVETFDSVGVEESLVERVVESFNSELLAQGGVSVDDIDPETIDGGLIGIEIEDEDGDLLDAEEIAEAIRERQREVIRDAVDQAVNDPEFPEQFTRALENSHPSVLDAIELDLGLRDATTSDGEMFISLEDSYDDVVRELEKDPITVGLSVAASNSSGRLKIGDRTTTIDYVWSFLARADSMASTFTLAAIISLVAAALLAERRPWTIIAAGCGVLAVAVIILVVMYVILGMMPLLTESRVSSALVGSVYQKALSPMTQLQITIGAIGIGVAVVGWLTRWIWPDDWVYSHYDDGTGTRAVARRATRSERRSRRSAGPAQQPQESYPQQGYPSGQYQQPQQGYPQQPAEPAWPNFPDPVDSGPRSNGSQRRAAPRELGPGTSPDESGGGWDYDSSSW